MAGSARPTGDEDIAGGTVGPVGQAPARTRSRGRQWLAIGVSAAAVAGALVGGLAVAGHGTATRQGAPVLVAAAHKAPARPAAVSTPKEAVVAQPAGPKSPATAATVVYRLQQLLPPGHTSGYARASDGSVFGQVYDNQGHGPAMVRLSVGPMLPTSPAECSIADSDMTEQCGTLPDGAKVTVIRIADNCIQSLVVDVYRGNGVGVEIQVSTCLAWNGTSNPPTAPALTQAQATTIAADPTWGTKMDSALVAAARQRFPHLPTFS
jgi:hypothetical protein